MKTVLKQQLQVVLNALMAGMKSLTDARSVPKFVVLKSVEKKMDLLVVRDTCGKDRIWNLTVAPTKALPIVRKDSALFVKAEVLFVVSVK